MDTKPYILFIVDTVSPDAHWKHRATSQLYYNLAGRVQEFSLVANHELNAVFRSHFMTNT